MKGKILFFIKACFFLPHYLFFIFYKKFDLKSELNVWSKVIRVQRKNELELFLFFIINLKEYRSLFYYRTKGVIFSSILKMYAPGTTNLFIGLDTKVIENGLVIQHGHSTRIVPKSMGENCQVWHNVTIGRAVSGGARPEIGSNVKICTGAIVLGDVKIGNNVTIGAASLIVKNVPDNCIVVGNPARIIKKDGERVDILL